MRGKCNHLQSIQNEIALPTANLQLLKDIIFPATTEIIDCLDMADFMLQHIRIRRDIIDNPRYDYLFTVEEVNRLVLDGMPFREAYKKVGLEAQEGTYQPVRSVSHTHAGSINNPCNPEIALKFQKLYD